MNITVVTPPPFEPITLAQAYQHLRWDTEDEGSPSETIYPLQDLIERNITTARTYVEQITRRALVRQTLKMVLPAFPVMRSRFSSRWGDVEDDYYTRPGYVELPRAPTAAVVSVKYLDQNEAEQTLSSASYYLDTDSSPVARLYFRDNFDTHIANCERADAVRIVWTAGYAPGDDSPSETQINYAANIPKGILDAILIQVQLLSDRFESAERMALERARNSLLTSFTIDTF